MDQPVRPTHDTSLIHGKSPQGNRHLHHCHAQIGFWCFLVQCTTAVLCWQKIFNQKVFSFLSSCLFPARNKLVSKLDMFVFNYVRHWVMAPLWQFLDIFVQKVPDKKYQLKMSLIDLLHIKEPLKDIKRPKKVMKVLKAKSNARTTMVSNFYIFFYLFGIIGT